ncbi:MAG: WD40 repeat domain-containing protein, partial [Paracoccaceae bacterium]
EVTTAPEIPVETGPGKSRPGSGARSETLISAALNARYFSLNTAQKLHGGRILLGRHFSLARNTLVNAQSGETRPVALPESIGKRAGRFSLNPGSGRALVHIRGRGPAIVDLNDPAVLILPDDARDDEIPIAHASIRDHWLTATPARILTRDGQTGRLIGWYTYGDGSGRRPEFELGYAQNVMAITQGNRIRFLRLFFEERPHSTDVSPDGGRILAAHRAYPQSYVSSASPGGQVIETPIPDIEIARIIAGPGETVAALDTEGRFHYWPDGLDGRRMDPDIPTVDMTNAGFDHIPFLFGADFLAIGGYHGPCGLWSLTDWRRISGFTHAGCSVDAFVYDAARNRLAVLGGFDGNVSVYDAGSGEFLAHFRKQEPLTDTTNLSAANAWFSQDGESLHIVGARGWQVDLDIETGALARGEDLPRDSAIRVARNGQAAVTTGHDENGSYMSLPGRSALIRPPEGWSFSRTALSADGGTIASYLSAHDGNAVRLALIDAAKGRILLTYSLPLFDSRFPEGHLRFSPDGRWITAFETPGRVWSFPTTEAGLIDLAMTRFREMTATEACRWFMCK